MMEKTPKQSFITLARWILIAAVAGVSSALIVTSFNALLNWVIEKTPGLLPGAAFLIPLCGAIIVGAVFLRRIPETGGEGIPTYLIAVNRRGGKLSLPATILKFPATIITLGFHGSGGIVGPLARICAGISSFLNDTLLRLSRYRIHDDLRIAAICGVSGAVSAIFHSPLGGGVYAVEILRKKDMSYSDLFPSILAGGVAFVSSSYLLHQKAVFSISAPAVMMNPPLLLYLPLVGAVAGMFGILFITVFERVSRGIFRIPGGQPLIAMAGGTLLCIVWLLNARWSLNTSMPLYSAIASGSISEALSQHFLQQHVATLLLIVILTKILATSFTVGSGMSGGFTGPLVIIGIGSGALMSSLAGITAGSPGYFGFLACGLPAVMGAAMNVPLAAIIITVRMFGPDYIIPAVIGGVISFLLYKAITIYRYSIIAGTLHPEKDSNNPPDQRLQATKRSVEPKSETIIHNDKSYCKTRY